MVSCYENKYHKDAKNLAPYEMLFHHYLFGYLRKDRGFEKFIDRLVRIPRPLLEQHISMQADMLGDLDFVGKMENIGEDFAIIQEKYMLKPLEHFNNTGKVYEKQNWMEYYSLQTAEKVYKKYKTDFEKYGYSDSYRTLTDYIKAKENR